MTDDVPLQPGATTDPQLVEEIGTKPDPTLAMLVSTINAVPGMEVGVTLYIGGHIVSGLIVGGRVYFEKVAALLQDKGPIGEALGGAFTNVAKQYAADERENRSEQDDAEDERRTGYIHLRAATVHSPGLGAALEQDLWRGRLSTVAGWSLGTFGSKAPEQG